MKLLIIIFKIGDRNTEDHHIPSEADYVVTPKSLARPNGIAPNKITITSNPLADADNKVR